MRVHRLNRIFATLPLLLFMVVFALGHRVDAQTSPTPQVSIPVLPPAIPSATTPSVAVTTPTVPNITAPSITAPVISVPGASTTVAGTTAGSDPATLSIDLGNSVEKPSSSVLIIIALTVMSIAPSLLIMMTSFTRIIIVLSLTRNAVGLQSIPPSQVVTGLALFLSLFVMAPTFSKMNDQGIQPFLKGEISQSEAFDKATGPLRDFMLNNTRRAELKMMVDASGQEKPADEQHVSLTTLIPAFMLSEVKTAFIIGFVIFIPFIVIDLVVSSILMSLGMMMLPPAFVSLPFKLLLFVMVDGWALVAETLVRSFN
ncbi:MAG: flagellar type III secretion system pore protein FliP [Acidimicrobiia bacterium]